MATSDPVAVVLDAGAVGAARTPPAPQPAVLTRPPADVSRGVVLRRIARRLSRPVQIVDAPGDAAGRLFVVEQGGRILLLVDEAVAATPFADLSKRVTRRGNEQGLLGLAFHPRFAANGLLYVNYTAKAGGTTMIVERKVSAANPDVIDGDYERVLLTVAQPYSNHNAGDVQFGPDGKLYVGFGDGGAAGDPENRSQNDASYLGKMVRIDVDTPEPVVDVVAKGLRNPWRYSFDRETGDLYIGDVGQNRWEWVVIAPAGQLEGKNFGWNITEGLHCFRPAAGCDRTGITPPVLEYDHKTGCSLTGGFVYRGAALPKLRGHYFYADYCTGLLRSFRWQQGTVTELWDWKPVLDPGFKLAALSSFGQDLDGELYLVSLDGVIWKLAVE